MRYAIPVELIVEAASEQTATAMALTLRELLAQPSATILLRSNGLTPVATMVGKPMVRPR